MAKSIRNVVCRKKTHDREKREQPGQDFHIVKVAVEFHRPFDIFFKDGRELYASGQVICVKTDQNTNTSTGLSTMYFVDFMSDLFHEGIPDSYTEDVFDVMRRVPRHTFQVLTKRAERMVKFRIYPMEFQSKERRIFP